QLQQDPYTDITEWSAQNGVEGMFFKDLESLQSAMIRGREVENPTITNTQRLRLEAELYDAANASERLRILSDFTAANPTALSGADVSRYAEGIFAEANPGSLINDPTIKQFRQSFGDTLAEFQLGAGFDSNKLSYLRTQGIRLFNEYLLRGAGNVDMNDPVAVSEFVDKVEDLVVRDLTRMFPDTMVKKLGEGEAGPALGTHLGVPEALQERQAEITAQSAAEFARLAGVQNSVNPEGVPTETPEAEDIPLEEQAPPFEDPDSDEAYPPTREGFYGELIQRFTDGVDSRSSTQSYQSAIEVWNEDPEFASEVDRVANKFGVNPAMLMAVMDFETGGTYSTSVRNAAGSGATGLIQFMPNTARALGTTTEELAQMPRAEQMTYVEKYFDQFGSRIRGGDINDLYMAVLYPRAIGREDGYVLFREGTTAYQQNAGLDTNEDGTITKFEAAAKVRQRFTG
ncbi:transglycosylase SLT domain-containing protein, partial [Marinobacterium sp. xm-d-509]|uniref:transglycosylase SLT domain-containing protein n=1 Tax=Marinobacterium sp. xm-d-509 TaxID=2497739 RepID=UPI001C2C270C